MVRRRCSKSSPIRDGHQTVEHRRDAEVRIEAVQRAVSRRASRMPLIPPRSAVRIATFRRSSARAGRSVRKRAQPARRVRRASRTADAPRSGDPSRTGPSRVRPASAMMIVDAIRWCSDRGTSSRVGSFGPSARAGGVRHVQPEALGRAVDALVPGHLGAAIDHYEFFESSAAACTVSCLQTVARSSSRVIALRSRTTTRSRDGRSDRACRFRVSGAAPLGWTPSRLVAGT